MSATYKLTLKQSYMFFLHYQKSLLDMFACCVWGLTFMKIVFLDTQRFHLAGIAFGQKM